MTHSNFRAYVIHGTNHSRCARNVAFDVNGFALYLEDGVEEFNVIEYNLIAHVHPILRPAVADDDYQVEAYDITIPFDISASPYFLSNTYNYVRGNAVKTSFHSCCFFDCLLFLTFPHRR